MRNLSSWRDDSRHASAAATAGAGCSTGRSSRATGQVISLDQPMIATMLMMCEPRSRSPVTDTCAVAVRLSIPFVKMRHAMSCGIVVSDTCRPSWRLDLHPAIAVAIEIPAAAAFAGHIEPQVRACLSWPIAIGERQRAHEAIEHRIVQLARHDSRAVRRQPDLLLMMPSLGQLARRIEPVQRRSSPAQLTLKAASAIGSSA